MKRKKIIAYGAGKCLTKFAKQINRKYKICYVSDRDNSKWGKEVLPGGIKCISPDEAIKENILIIIFIENRKVAEKVRKELISNGAAEVKLIQELKIFIRYKLHRICSEEKNIDWLKFFYCNYISKQFIRDKEVFYITHKGTVLDISRSAQIILKGNDATIGGNIMKGSKTETQIRIRDGAVLNLNNGCYIFYNVVLELNEKARLDAGYFSINGGSVVVCKHRMTFGEDVMLGRNIIIYDSDFHKVVDENGRVKNQSKEVKIGNHVWLTNQIMVLKGVSIGDGALVSPYTVVRKNIEAHKMIASPSASINALADVKWLRDAVD